MKQRLRLPLVLAVLILTVLILTVPKREINAQANLQPTQKELDIYQWIGAAGGFMGVLGSTVAIIGYLQMQSRDEKMFKTRLKAALTEQ